MPHTLGAPQPAAYVFGPWTTPTDRPNFAYRSAPREDDRAEVWLHVPDDGKDPYWAGCFGGSDCFDLRGPSTMAEAKQVMDQRLVLAGHLLAECVDRDRRTLEDARRWEDVARVAREIDAKHRGDGLMADDDTVDLIAQALKDFPGLVQERDRLKAVLDAEQGKRGRPGWTWRNLRSEGPAAGQWERDAPANVVTTGRFGGFESLVAWGGPRPGWMAVGPGGQHEGGADVDDGLDAMEQADAFVGDL